MKPVVGGGFVAAVSEGPPSPEMEEIRKRKKSKWSLSYFSQVKLFGLALFRRERERERIEEDEGEGDGARVKDDEKNKL